LATNIQWAMDVLMEEGHRRKARKQRRVRALWIQKKKEAVVVR